MFFIWVSFKVYLIVFKVLWKKQGQFLFFEAFTFRYSRIRIRNSALDAETARAAASHLFFADPDTAVFLNADPDPALKNVNLNFVKIYFRQYGTEKN